MKIQKLEIKNIRGIPDFQIEPNGKSFVIYGPNGSGKSAVIDAIDFLLTGKIARLTGEGTDGITLKEYGPHIDKVSDLSNVEVRAEIKVPGIEENVSISRKMQQPNELVYNNTYELQLSPLLELLNRGQYVFTRREVLKLITSKSSTRAQEIQKILKLLDIEEIRANLVKVLNDYKREHQASIDSLKKAKLSVLAITGQSDYTPGDILNFINEQRVKLGGSVISEIISHEIQTGIAGVQINPLSINHSALKEQIASLKSVEVQKVSPVIIGADKKLKTVINSINGDSLATWNSKRYNFTKDGIKLIRKSGECPLCDLEWTEGELKAYLQKRIDSESERQLELSDNSRIIIEIANAFILRIQQLFQFVGNLSETETAKTNKIYQSGIETLVTWSGSLSTLVSALVNPVENYSDSTFPSEQVANLLSQVKMDDELVAFQSEVEKLFPEATPEQTSWDNLTKLSGRIQIVEQANDEVLSASLRFERANSLLNTFIESRDEVLTSLYENIKERFVSLYKEMHGEDEQHFYASLLPQESSLNFKVDFYGRGLHPPNAMHSEGHQDSMGVCLFLALSEYLNHGLIDLIILDDVVMSVDIGHRRAFCSVLSSNFSDKQFIITTHDTTWANQLRADGLVNRKQMLKFSDWSVDVGPRINYEADLWNRINEDLSKNDISAASAKLRNGLEDFTRFVCHNLRAKVPYSLDDGGSLGDFLPAAIGAYKDLLGKAKDAANSWNRREEVEKLNQVSIKSTDIIKRALGDQWTINSTVHFNAWANLGKEDFSPVIDAFHELCESVFSCDNEGCGSALKVTLDGANINGVRCNCGNVNWNLTKKEN